MKNFNSKKHKTGTFTVVTNLPQIIGMKARSQAIWLWLRKFAGSKNSCHPSIKLLSKCAGVSKNSTYKSLKELERAGLMKRERRFSKNRQTSNIYRLIDVDQTNVDGNTYVKDYCNKVSQIKDSQKSDKGVSQKKESRLSQNGDTELHSYEKDSNEKDIFDYVEKEEEKKIANEVTKIIGLFKNMFPGEFINEKKNPYAIPAVREVVKSALEKHSYDGLRDMIQEYESKRFEQFCPSAGTVYEFFVWKFPKIETFLKKKSASPHLRNYKAPDKPARDPKEAIHIEWLHRNIQRRKEGKVPFPWDLFYNKYKDNQEIISKYYEPK